VESQDDNNYVSYAKEVENSQDYPKSKKFNKRVSMSKGNLPALPGIQDEGEKDEGQMVSGAMFKSPSTQSLLFSSKMKMPWVPWGKSKTSDEPNDTLSPPKSIKNRNLKSNDDISSNQSDLDGTKLSPRTGNKGKVDPLPLYHGTIRADISCDGIEDYYLVLTNRRLLFFKGT
jgi:hypothetical protein